MLETIRAHRDLALALAAAQGIREACEAVLAFAMGIEGIDCGGIYVVDPLTGGADMLSHAGLSPDFVSATSHVAADSTPGRILHSGQPMYADYQSVEMAMEGTGDGQGFLCLAALPVLHEGEVVGGLNVASRSVHGFSEGTRLALEGLAGHVAGSIKRLRAEEAVRARDARLSALMANMQDVISVLAPDGTLAYVSPNLEKRYGWSPGDISGTPFHTRVHPDDLPAVDTAFADIVKAGKAAKTVLEFRYRLKDGSYKWVELTAMNMLHDPAIGGILVNNHDITERRLAEERVQLEQLRLALALEASGDGIWETNHLTGELHASDRYYEMLGYKPGDFTSRREWLDLIHPDDVPILAGLYDYTLTRDKYEMEVRRRAKDGSWRWILTRGKVIGRGPDGRAVRVLGVSTDVTERRLKEEELRFLGTHDKLTGLYNRGYVEGLLRADPPEWPLPVGFIMGDVNGLKLTNDTFGHASGDRLLTLTASLMAEAVGDKGLVARWGGDEFLVILPGMDSDGVIDMAEVIRRALADAPLNPFPLSCALGQATWSSGEQPVEEVLREAEEIMYHGKLTEGKSARSAIISALRESLAVKTLETDEHCHRMRDAAVRVARHMSLPDSQRDDLVLLALLHDIGKIGVPEGILTKPGGLTPEERTAIEKHAGIGYRIAKASYELAHIADGILSHHEWWDGNGYPQGLSGDAIPLVSRIISVIDAYDAMTSDRPYRAALTLPEAVRELRRCSGTQFDPMVVGAVIAACFGEPMQEGNQRDGNLIQIG